MIEELKSTAPTVKLAELVADNWEILNGGVCVANKATLLKFDLARIPQFRDFWCAGFAHLELMWTLKAYRGQGFATKALKQLREFCEIAGCGMTAVVRPCEVNNKPRFIQHAAQLIVNRRIRYVDDADNKQAESTKRLLLKAGFVSGFDLPSLGNFGNPDFPRDRIFCLMPSTLDEKYSAAMQYLNVN